MLNEDEIDPKLCAQLLSRCEEADGARVLAVQAVERVEVGPAELLVLAALVRAEQREQPGPQTARRALLAVRPVREGDPRSPESLRPPLTDRIRWAFWSDRRPSCRLRARRR